MKIITAMLLSIAMLLSCVVVLADTVSPETAVEAPTAAYELLEKGSKGHLVNDMQTRLAELGYYTSKVDGDYGNGTKKAVESFQTRNGLEATGIADTATLALLYSKEALKAPKEPGVVITKVKYTKSYDRLSVTVKNNLDQKITYIDFKAIYYNASGSIVSSTGSSTITSVDSDDITEHITLGRWGITCNIKSKGSSTIYLDTSKSYGIPEFAMGIKDYTTEDGGNHILSYEQMTFLSSNNRTVYPTEDLEPEYVISNEDAEKASKLNLEYEACEIPYYYTPVTKTPTGRWVNSVVEGSIADQAGLKVNDVIVLLDGIEAIKPYAVTKAICKVIDGETVSVEYYRNNRTYQTSFVLDMEKESTESDAKITSVADELLKWGELLEKGLITQEEYDAQKSKLLS